MTPVLFPCSRSAHDQNVLARRPQWDQHVCHSWESETSKLGRIIWKDEDRSMRAVKGHIRPPSERDKEYCETSERNRGQLGWFPRAHGTPTMKLWSFDVRR